VEFLDLRIRRRKNGERAPWLVDEIVPKRLRIGFHAHDRIPYLLKGGCDPGVDEQSGSIAKFREEVW
jgi:hypothetical protein